MNFTTTILCEKTTGNFKLVAVRREYKDGNVKFGSATAKRGRKGWSVRWGYSESQARRLVRVHCASDDDPNILYYCG